MAIKSWGAAAVVTASLLSTAAFADKINIDMAPGLWENSFEIEASGQIGAALREAQKYMANMPEADRKMMEAMLQQQGISVSSNLTVVKACITQEQIDGGELPQAESGCEQNLEQTGKNSFRVSFDCPQGKGSGEMRLLDRKHYTGELAMVSTVGGAAPETVNVKQSGKWLSADCGELQPVQ